MAKTEQIRINHFIKAREVRVVGAEGENLGTMDSRNALKIAQEAELDLIEISPNANPPIVKIMDFGKFQYEQKKKAKIAKAKAHFKETKVVQLKGGARIFEPGQT